MTFLDLNVRSYLGSGHRSNAMECPFRAKGRHPSWLCRLLKLFSDLFV